jgi:hypothetical protein
VNGVSINGGRNGENGTLVDGVANTKANRGVSLIPTLSRTQEVAVQSNIYDAQYGRFGGGVTSISVKSGTNSPHGEVYEFLKNVKLDATEWVLNSLDTPRTRFQNNTFGFETDGPVYIPKVVDGRTASSTCSRTKGRASTLSLQRSARCPHPKCFKATFRSSYRAAANS